MIQKVIKEVESSISQFSDFMKKTKVFQVDFYFQALNSNYHWLVSYQKYAHKV